MRSWLLVALRALHDHPRAHTQSHTLTYDASYHHHHTSDTESSTPEKGSARELAQRKRERFSQAILHMLVYSVHTDLVCGRVATAVTHLESVVYQST